MVTISGFDVKFTHRGSWKASLILRGEILDEIPVAWHSDWLTQDTSSSLCVWFKDNFEAIARLNLADPFTIALMKGSKDGAASSANIIGLFKVEPIEIVGKTHRGLRCKVVRRISVPDDI